MAGGLQLELPMAAIEELCRKYHVRELSIFGSALRPGFGANSDVDLLVLFEPDAAIGLEFVTLQRELSDAIGRRVDLVPKNSLKPLIRDEVLSEAQVLYAERETVPE
jgi:predicted nucleotidyltransferase